MNLNKRLYLNYTVGSERYIGSTFRSGTPSFNQLDIVNENSSNGRIRLMINTEENVIIENSQLYSKRVITAVAGVKGNIYNSNGDNDVLLQRDGATALTLKENNQVQFSGYVLVNNISTPTNTDLALRRSDTELIRLNSSNQIQLSGNLLVNTINSNGDNDVVIQRNGTPYLKLNGTTNRVETGSTSIGLDAFTVYLQHLKPKDYTSGDTVFYGNNSTDDNYIEYMRFDHDLESVEFDKPVKTNVIDTKTNTDLVINRNGNEFFRCEVFTDAQATTYNLIDVNAGTRFSAHHVYVGNIINRANGFDTVYTGSNAAGDGRVDYMKWSYSTQQIDLECPLDATGYDITGNIVNTGVSDKRLKTNIQDIDDANYSDCVKNVKLKTFEFKDNK